MTAVEFKDKIGDLLPGYSQAALNELNNFMGFEATENGYLVSSNRDEFYAAFLVVSRQHGTETALTLFNLGEVFIMNSFELQGAAELLSGGMPLDKVCEAVTQGRCSLTPENGAVFNAALREIQSEPSPSSMEMGM